MALPVELLISILTTFFEPGWAEKEDSRTEIFKLRLVCKTFDSIIRPLAFGDFPLADFYIPGHHYKERLEAPTSNETWVIRLLMEKMTRYRRTHDYLNLLFAMIEMTHTKLQSITKDVPHQEGSTDLMTDICRILVFLVDRHILYDCIGDDNPPPEEELSDFGFALNVASYQGNASAVKQLLEMGAPVGFANKVLPSPLHSAAMGGSVPVGELLIGHGADINDNRELDHETPLHFAAKFHRDEFVRLLLRHGADRQRVDDRGMLALHNAASAGSVVSVSQLLVNDPPLEKGTIYADLKDEDGCTPLALAAVWNYEEICRLLIAQDGVNVNSADNKGRTPLCEAARYDAENVVRLLLAEKALDPNAPDSTGRPPLALAIKHGCESIVRLLLDDKRVDPNLRDERGHTPLIHAVRYRQEAMVQVLLDHNGVVAGARDNNGEMAIWHGDTLSIVRLFFKRADVNVNAWNFSGKTVLSACVEQGIRSWVETLLDHEGLDVNYKDRDGNAPLSIAASRGQTKIAELLLRHKGIEINIRDGGSLTPLASAAERGHLDIVKMLLQEKDIEANAESDGGQTPLTLASLHGYDGVVRLLLKHGVPVDHKDANGRTPLSYAAENRNVDVVRLLLQHGDVDVDSRDVNDMTPLLHAYHEEKREQDQEIIELMKGISLESAS